MRRPFNPLLLVLLVPACSLDDGGVATNEHDRPVKVSDRLTIVEKGDDGYGMPIPKQEWEDHLDQPQRIDSQSAFREKYGSDPKAKLVTWGKGKKSTANSRYEAGEAPRGNAVFSGKD